MMVARCSALLLPLFNYLIFGGFAVSLISAEKPERYCVGAGCRSPFRIIIDGGSTGSRLHIFEFVGNATSTNDDDDEVTCVRRGSVRADVPMSAFARTSESERRRAIVPSSVAAHMVPLFDYAAEIIPEVHHADTEIRYAATAGMRLVEEAEQSAVYDALYEGLRTSTLPSSGRTFPFSSLRRKDIATLSGELEGFYGALAANYLTGNVDAELRTRTVVAGDDDDDEGPVGAMDMGGSSTQLVFAPSWPHQLRTSHARLDEKDFYSRSYLSYGVDQVRETLWSRWIEEGDDRGDPIRDPCSFVGLKLRWKGRMFVGTGDVPTCTAQIRRILPSLTSNVPGEKGVVGGVRNPPIRGKFLAMSLYFFVLDFLRVMVPSTPLRNAWPTPTLEELAEALPGLCSREWEGDLEFYEHSTHKYTRPEILPYRCFEAVYLVSILRDGFGFDTKTRDVSFIFDVNGSEVEWTLGMALSSYSAEQDETVVDDIATSTMNDVAARVQAESVSAVPMDL